MAATTGNLAGAESNALVISYAPEVTWATLPAVAFQAIRATGESLSGSKQRSRPSEINTNRSASAAVTQQESAGGAVNFALSYDTYDDLLAGVVNNDWSAAFTVTGAAADIVFTTGVNTITSATANKFQNVLLGQWIKVAGCTLSSGANNGWTRVIAKPSNLSLTVSKALVTETPSGATCTIKGQNLRSGALFKSFYLQKQLGTGLFLRYPGAYVSKCSLGVSVGQFFQGSFDFIAQAESKSTTDASTGAVLTAPVGKVHDGVSGFKGIYLDDVLVTTGVDSFSLDVMNDGAAAQYALGSASAAGMMGGTLTVSGRLRAYFKDFTLYDRFKNETGGVLSVLTADAAGATYVVTLMNATIMNPSVVAGGPNQPVMAEFTLEGNPDANGITLQIDQST